MEYSYDNQGQLLSAVHKSSGTTTRTETYSYDTYGNIRSFNNGTRSQEYIYGNADWKDLLTGIKIDNQTYSLTYDNIGNPTSYYNGSRYSMSWSEGRRLASLTAGGNTTTYTYDLNGLRTKKQNPDGTYIKYFIADGKILGETLYRANNTEVYDMRYTFDENGDVSGISLWRNNSSSWTKYYFLKNLQGDVLAIYKSGDTFTKVGEYTYDSWGNVLSVTGVPSNDNAAVLNPFRYRSYYHDSETGFYYLQSRYYDPAIGRFINSDEFSSTGQDFMGYNIFAYCNNNPVNTKDSTGTLGLTAILGIISVGVISGVCNGVSAVKSGGSFWAGAGVGFVNGVAGAATALAVHSCPVLRPFESQINVALRTGLSFVGNIATEVFSGNEISGETVLAAATDAVMDGMLSTVSYYYNPISSSSVLLGPVVNAAIDGATDVGETYLYRTPSTSHQNQSAGSGRNAGKSNLAQYATAQRLAQMERRLHHGR